PVALPGSPRSRPSFPTRRSSDLHCFRPRVLPAKGDQRLAWRADEVDGCEPRAVGIEGEARLERVHRRAAGKVYGYEPPAPLPPSRCPQPRPWRCGALSQSRGARGGAPVAGAVTDEQGREVLLGDVRCERVIEDGAGLTDPRSQRRLAKLRSGKHDEWGGHEEPIRAARGSGR